MKRKTTILFAAMSAFLALPAAEGLGETRLQKTFGPWRVDCTEPDGKSAKSCTLRFALVNTESKRVVFSWTVARKDKQSAANKVIVRTPTGVLLPDGVSIAFAGTEPVKVSYLTCGPNACFAEFDFSDQWVKAFAGKPSVSVSYKAVNGTPLRHEIDLKDFAAGLAFFTAQLDAATAQ
jgi:invasion protein IalB